jgi:hypothetical protein
MAVLVIVGLNRHGQKEILSLVEGGTVKALTLGVTFCVI